MPAIFSKNCVLTGDVDSYCLVCSTCLPGHEDVLAHIQESKHNASMKSVTYFEKYKDDFIIKVKGVYYCELCNKTFPTTTKVGIHVTEVSHLEGKRRQLKRVGSSVVLQNNIVISDRAWNSFVEDTCVLCDAEYEDYSTHTSEQTHILNLFRSSVTIDNKNNIYRKVDGGHQCLTCNKVLSDDLITEHLNSSQHKDTLVQYDPNENDVSNVDNAINVDENGKKYEEENEPKGDCINETSGNATDEETSTKNQSIINDGKTLYTRPVLMKGKDKPATTKTVPEEVETIAKQHNLSVNKFNNTVYCNVCTLQIPAILNCVKEHVAGKKHKDKSAQPTKQQNTKKIDTKRITTVKMTEFIQILEQIEARSGRRYVIINETYCVLAGDFLGLARFGPKLICCFCHIDLWEENVKKHLRSQPHRNKMENSRFVTSLENEFVRQVSSDLYHCVHCSAVANEFDEMLDHLNTPEHKLRKAENEKILEQYMFQKSITGGSDAVQFLNFLQFWSIMENMRRFQI